MTTVKYFALKCSIVLLIVAQALTANSQERERTQYPLLLNNAYFEINVGYINYPFSQEQIIAPNCIATNIEVPHTAVRIIPYGYRFNKYLSAQLSYMRPVLWVRYTVNDAENDTIIKESGPIYMNIGGVTLKGTLPITKKFSLLGEAGLGVITRSALLSKKELYTIIEEANYATFLFSGGIKYHLNEKWEFNASVAYSPKYDKKKQPYSVFYGGGFAFNMNALPDEKVKKNLESGYVFPRNIIEIGYTTNALGYGVNNFFSEGAIPVFWGGKAHIKDGVTLHYQRNSFHGRKVFSLDWGTSVAFGRSRDYNDKFFAISLYPMFRFTFLHTKYANLFFNYSLAGPTYFAYLSGGNTIDDVPTGPEFTFQDFMGMGGYFGPKKNVVFEARIAHYSNGNIFPHNEGIKVPLTFNLGYAF